jgi:hypothetical protein
LAETSYALAGAGSLPPPASTKVACVVKHGVLWLIAASLLAMPAAGAPRRPTKPVRKPPAKIVAKPAAAVPAGPTTPGIMVPKAVLLSKPTPIELRAHAVWTLRAALNVAALQCQYSPFLRVVDNYNQMLKKHGTELSVSQTRMIGHFTRTQKAGMAAFDRYNTRSYNSFSTLDAQYNFCWAAGQAGQSLRSAAVGAMAQVADTALPAIRSALAYVPPAAGLNVPPLPPLPDFRIEPVITADN